MRHLLVTWLDAYSPLENGWYDRAKIAADLKPTVCKSSGWLVAATDEQMIIAGSINPETDDVSNLTCIPKGCVVEMRDL